MNIIQLTPGAGAMYCGNCLRDNTLVAALRRERHEVLMVPLYLPLTLDEDDQSSGTPIFFNGINVYLEQRSGWFRQAPAWIHDLVASPKLLAWAGTKAAKTRPQDLGELTLSMLRGEQGNQARELERLLSWLRTTQPRPDIICLSNALLLGQARRLKAELRAPIVCTLQGEDTFLDALPTPHREACWQMLAERAKDVDAFIAPSQYFARLMSERLGLKPSRVHVVFNGLNLDAYALGGKSAATDSALTLGFFARMCREKGLDMLVEAYLLLRQRPKLKNLKLKVGGSCGPADEPFVNQLRRRLAQAGAEADAEFHRNVARSAKIEFLRGVSVFSVPAAYGEAFGLYVIEAMAAGVPVVQPSNGAFPELLEATGGGLLCEPGNPKALADALETLLSAPERARTLGEAGAKAVAAKFSADSMAQESLRIFRMLSQSQSSSRPHSPASTLKPQLS